MEIINQVCNKNIVESNISMIRIQKLSFLSPTWISNYLLCHEHISAFNNITGESIILPETGKY